MKNLLVIYNGSIEDKGRDSYLKAIKKEIPGAKMVDFNNPMKLLELPRTSYMTLFLKPMDEVFSRLLKALFNEFPSFDIEGCYTDKLTITAEAILRVLGKVENKKVVVLNQSNVLGKPLAKELINQGANVFSINSSFDKVFRLLYFIRPDILISASGDDDFKLKGGYLKDINIIIDLSDDVDFENKITSIPTIEVLKDRLRGAENEI